MDDKKKKEFIIPEADIMDFTKEDIITASNNGRGDWGAGFTEPWGSN